MAHAYPILLDLTSAKIVIIGGGKVASRKSAGVIEAGATNITVVSPEIACGFAPIVRVLQQLYAPDVLSGATLVFAATDHPEVNSQVVRDAQSRGILVNRADADTDPPGDFITPAKLVDGEVILSVAAGNPALAVAIRDGLRERIDPRWTAMAAAMQTLRPWLRDRAGVAPAQRAGLFRVLATSEAFDVLSTRGIEGLRAWIEDKIENASAS